MEGGQIIPSTFLLLTCLTRFSDLPPSLLVTKFVKIWKRGTMYLSSQVFRIVCWIRTPVNQKSECTYEILLKGCVTIIPTFLQGIKYVLPESPEDTFYKTTFLLKTRKKSQSSQNLFFSTFKPSSKSQTDIFRFLQELSIFRF